MNMMKCVSTLLLDLGNKRECRCMYKYKFAYKEVPKHIRKVYRYSARHLDEFYKCLSSLGINCLYIQDFGVLYSSSEDLDLIKCAKESIQAYYDFSYKDLSGVIFKCYFYNIILTLLLVGFLQIGDDSLLYIICSILIDLTAMGFISHLLYLLVLKGIRYRFFRKLKVLFM